MAGKSRQSANLVSDKNIFVDVTTDNTGIGTTSPKSKLDVRGNGIFSGIVTATQFIGDGSGLTNIAGSSSSRFTISGITTEIENNGIGNTEISGAKTYSILNIGISTASWIRIYNDEISRLNDTSRIINNDPEPGSGVIAEFISTGSTTIYTSPVPVGYNNDNPVTDKIYISAKNLSGISTTILVSLTILKMED